jgi:CHAT domain-containing protein
MEELGRRLAELDEIARSEQTETDAVEARSLGRALEAARGEYSATLVRAAEADAREPGRLTLLGARRPGLTEIQRALAPNEALLEYLLTPETLIAFVVRRDTVLSLSTEVSHSALASRIRIARNLLGRRGTDPQASRTVLSGLGELLLGPAEAAGALRGTERLIVVPHAELSYLPFAALRDAEGRYVAERYLVMHLPTGSALHALRDGRRRREGSSGASAFAPFPRELPASSREVEAVSKSMADVSVHRGAPASEKALRQALADDGIVHAATHGILNARNPMFSRIELAPGQRGTGNGGDRTGGGDPRDDGRLEVHELLGMRVNSRVVFLSGCETGTSAAWSTGFAGAEEYATLAQAFLHAGADNVVATLWRVDDEGAAAFAEAFYGALTEVSPADALARAQRAMIRHADYGAPYYWAAYRLSGSGQGLGGSQGMAAVAVRE